MCWFDINNNDGDIDDGSTLFAQTEQLPRSSLFSRNNSYNDEDEGRGLVDDHVVDGDNDDCITRRATQLPRLVSGDLSGRRSLPLGMDGLEGGEGLEPKDPKKISIWTQSEGHLQKHVEVIHV